MPVKTLFGGLQVSFGRLDFKAAMKPNLPQITTYDLRGTIFFFFFKKSLKRVDAVE